MSPTLADWHNTYGDDVYTIDQFQCRALELEPRSPVHINTASFELLTALIEASKATTSTTMATNSFVPGCRDNRE